MIDPSHRFWVASEQITGNVHTGQVIDWDQRRWYTIHGPLSLIPPEENVDVDILKRYIGQLGQTVQFITVDDKGQLVKVSSDPEDDGTITTHYPRFSTTPSLQSFSVVQHSQLTEEVRLGPGVDLNELHLTKALPKHPNIVPFDRVVLSGAESRLLGFTTPYFPNGTIDDNKDRVFKLAWFQQLLDVVDYLNFELGIVHQDIAPRNLLVDPETDNILIFDFDRAARVGQPSCLPERNDVTGVIFTLYEIVSQDDHFRRVKHSEQDPNSVLSIDNWPAKGLLDCNVGEFRKLLNNWVQRRKDRDVASKDLPFTPSIPDVPPASPVIRGRDESGEPIWGKSFMQIRRNATKFNENVIFWERPPRQLTPIE